MLHASPHGSQIGCGCPDWLPGLFQDGEGIKVPIKGTLRYISAPNTKERVHADRRARQIGLVLRQACGYPPVDRKLDRGYGGMRLANAAGHQESLCVGELSAWQYRHL